MLGLAASESCPNLLNLEGAVLRAASGFASTASPACADTVVVCGSGTVTFADAFAVACVIVVSSLAGTCTSSAALQRLLLHEFGVCLDFLGAAKDHNVRHASYAADLA